MSRLKISDLRVAVSGLDHPEGVACGSDRRIYAGGEAGQIYEIPPEGGSFTQRATTGGFILGVALDQDHNVYACDMTRAAVLKITPSGDVSDYSTGDGVEAIRVPNYLVFDANGNLYVSDSGTWRGGDSRVWKVRPGGDARIWCTAAREFANGLALSPDDAYLYVAESTIPGVTRVAIKPDGTAGSWELVVEMPGTVPDGLAFDAGGNLYISCYRPDRIYVLSVKGNLDVLIEDETGQDLNAPTNIAFGGTHLDRLIIASLGGWGLADIPMPVRGHRLHYPKVEG